MLAVKSCSLFVKHPIFLRVWDKKEMVGMDRGRNGRYDFLFLDGQDCLF